jgi:FMN phosphatase YigB (HAD superfamily)
MDLAGYKALSFDCYGTLIDWEAGIAAVLVPWASEVGLDLDAERLLAGLPRLRRRPGLAGHPLCALHRLERPPRRPLWTWRAGMRRRPWR